MQHDIPVIDYGKVARAQRHYAECGYAEVPVPWIVGPQAYAVTRPPGSDVRDFYALGGYLNASGEQGFIQLLQGGARLGRNSCVTPCFRNEAAYDRLHHPYFLKLELIDTAATAESLRVMIQDARTFFDAFFPAAHPVKVVPMDDSGETFDLVDGLHGIELGSYGIRRLGGLQWTYGTGVALPRLDTVLAEYGKENGHV